MKKAPYNVNISYNKYWVMKMKKVLLIGGTGTISMPITEALAQDDTIELYVFNRGHKQLPQGVIQIIGDINDDELMKTIANQYQFDVVANFIVYTKKQALKQIEIFKGKIKQYIFISTVVTYNHEKAVCLNETSEQYNCYSRYGQEKLACEQVFKQATDFPVTIVRPSQTYSLDRIPLSVKGKSCYSVIDRMINDKPVIVHGDGKSTWHCTHANDFLKGFIPLIGNDKAIYQDYQIISDEIVNWDMIYHQLYHLLGKTPNIIHLPSDFLSMSVKYANDEAILGDKQYSCIYDMSKIKSIAPNFNCDISINEGLKMYLQYIKDHPECCIKDEAFDKWCDFVIERYLDFVNSMKGRF